MQYGTKKELLHSLTNVKFVIGNGFDLHCGLKTSYYDFFNSDYYELDKIRYFFEVYTIHNLRYADVDCNGIEYATLSEAKRRILDLDDKHITFWDFFFYFSSIDLGEQLPNVKWCDIENTIYNFFHLRINGCPSLFELIVAQLNEHTREEIVNDKICALIHAVLIRMGRLKIQTDTELARFLLDELKLFEKRFGKFIQNQYDDLNYICNADGFVREVFGKNNPFNSVDCFNYGISTSINFHNVLRYINGNSNSPIFGIDSMGILPSEPYYIFTKTSRRMDADLRENTYHPNSNFDSLVIYGHSLTPSDYSYFFPVFDQMELTDFRRNSKIVFLYSVYDKNKKEEIINENNSALTNIFVEYAKYRSFPNPERFIDFLSTSGRLFCLETPNEQFLEKSWH